MHEYVYSESYWWYPNSLWALENESFSSDSSSSPYGVSNTWSRSYFETAGVKDSNGFVPPPTSSSVAGGTRVTSGNKGGTSSGRTRRSIGGFPNEEGVGASDTYSRLATGQTFGNTQGFSEHNVLDVLVGINPFPLTDGSGKTDFSSYSFTLADTNTNSVNPDFRGEVQGDTFSSYRNITERGTFGKRTISNSIYRGSYRTERSGDGWGSTAQKGGQRPGVSTEIESSWESNDTLRLNSSSSGYTNSTPAFRGATLPEDFDSETDDEPLSYSGAYATRTASGSTLSTREKTGTLPFTGWSPWAGPEPTNNDTFTDDEPTPNSLAAPVSDWIGTAKETDTFVWSWQVPISKTTITETYNPTVVVTTEYTTWIDEPDSDDSWKEYPEVYYTKGSPYFNFKAGFGPISKTVSNSDGEYILDLHTFHRSLVQTKYDTDVTSVRSIESSTYETTPYTTTDTTNSVNEDNETYIATVTGTITTDVFTSVRAFTEEPLFGVERERYYMLGNGYFVLPEPATEGSFTTSEMSDFSSTTSTHNEPTIPRNFRTTYLVGDAVSSYVETRTAPATKEEQKPYVISADSLYETRTRSFFSDGVKVLTTTSDTKFWNRSFFEIREQAETDDLIDYTTGTGLAEEESPIPGVTIGPYVTVRIYDETDTDAASKWAENKTGWASYEKTRVIVTQTTENVTTSWAGSDGSIYTNTYYSIVSDTLIYTEVDWSNARKAEKIGNEFVSGSGVVAGLDELEGFLEVVSDNNQTGLIVTNKHQDSGFNSESIQTSDGVQILGRYSETRTRKVFELSNDTNGDSYYQLTTESSTDENHTPLWAENRFGVSGISGVIAAMVTDSDSPPFYRYTPDDSVRVAIVTNSNDETYLELVSNRVGLNWNSVARTITTGSGSDDTDTYETSLTMLRGSTYSFSMENSEDSTLLSDTVQVVNTDPYYRYAHRYLTVDPIMDRRITSFFGNNGNSEITGHAFASIINQSENRSRAVVFTGTGEPLLLSETTHSTLENSVIAGVDLRQPTTKANFVSGTTADIFHYSF